MCGGRAAACRHLGLGARGSTTRYAAAPSGAGGAEMRTRLDATTTPFSLSVLTATKGNASKRLIPDVNNRPIKDPAHMLGISAGRDEHGEVAGLAGFGDLLQRITPQQALVHGIPKGSTPGAIFTLTTAERYAGAPGTIARTL